MPITLYQDPAELRSKIREIAALYLAAGIDPKDCSIMVQSAVLKAHAELALDAHLRHPHRLAGTHDAIQGQIRRAGNP